MSGLKISYTYKYHLYVTMKPWIKFSPLIHNHDYKFEKVNRVTSIDEKSDKKQKHIKYIYCTKHFTQIMSLLPVEFHDKE